MSLSARLAKRIDDARASYWFVPSVLVVVAIALAQVTLLADRHAEMLPGFVDTISLITSEDGARAVVSVIAQAMIGVAGVLFSITMLAVSFASGQFGPRLIGNFMRDRGNQWSLGLLIATFTYALLILRAVANPADGIDAFVPHLSVVVAMALGLICVFVVIFHVHHVPETISVSNIIADLGRRYMRDIKVLADNPANPANLGVGPFCDLEMKTAGYVHNVATNTLSALCRSEGWTISLLVESGAFVHRHVPVLRVRGPESLTEDQRQTLRQAVALGDAKTENQNVLFVAEQLVEIVARAMSPGVNDPFTAITAMQWLEAGLSEAVGKEDALTVITADGVVGRTISFERLLQASLGDCVSYVQGDVLTRRSLLTLLEGLADRATPANRAAVAQVEAQLRSEAAPVPTPDPSPPGPPA